MINRNAVAYIKEGFSSLFYLTYIYIYAILF
nr:MAG TPA: hypothetical protein [Bacteriophage sp.]